MAKRNFKLTFNEHLLKLMWIPLPELVFQPISYPYEKPLQHPCQRIFARY
jgi:hypothetical protein